MNASPVKSYFPFCAILLFFTIAISGCSRVSLVTDYDANTYEEIIRIGKEVDRFYGILLEQDESERVYKNYSAAYVEIEIDIRSLYIRNKSRPLNSESTQISKSMLDLWVKYKKRHKDNAGHEDKDTYKTGNAVLDRNRFIRLFIAAASAEDVKNLKTGDTDPTKESAE